MSRSGSISLFVESMDDKKVKINFGRKLKELTTGRKKKEKSKASFPLMTILAIALNLESIAPILEKLIAHVLSCGL